MFIEVSILPYKISFSTQIISFFSLTLFFPEQTNELSQYILLFYQDPIIQTHTEQLVAFALAD